MSDRANNSGMMEQTHGRHAAGGTPTRARRRAERRSAGFSLLEVLASLAILGLTCSSVFVVIDRCLAQASNSALRLEAFELARENLERILVSDTVEETVDYGTSDKYPDLSWQTVVEGFPEPLNGGMWVRAVCSAQYIDSTGETQTVELVHWLAPLTDQQAGQLIGQQDLEKLKGEQLIRTDEEAAKYARVDAGTISRWLREGLVKTGDGMFLRYNLDVFIQAKGSPTPAQKALQVDSVPALALKLRTEQRELEQTGPTGLSNKELETMSGDQIMDLVKNRRK
ncbi:MAG: type II secretion system protein [Planctomycetes bacterium]|nr:type II secretion system protein [Planctomycetota bacterium]